MPNAYLLAAAMRGCKALQAKLAINGAHLTAERTSWAGEVADWRPLRVHLWTPRILTACSRLGHFATSMPLLYLLCVETFRGSPCKIQTGEAAGSQWMLQVQCLYSHKDSWPFNKVPVDGRKNPWFLCYGYSGSKDLEIVRIQRLWDLLICQVDTVSWESLWYQQIPPARCCLSSAQPSWSPRHTSSLTRA